MVVLTEQIEIPASYEKLEAWTANFEEEFVKWSPYHIECNLYNGNYHAGNKVRFREIVMGLDKLLQKLDEVLSDRVHTIRVLLPYDKLGLAAPMRERGSVQVEEYREDGLYLEGIVKTEDLHCFEGYLV